MPAGISFTLKAMDFLLYVHGHGLSNQQQVVCRFSLEPLLRYTKLTKAERLAQKPTLRTKNAPKLRTLSYR